jgi:hypothetical protein
MTRRSVRTAPRIGPCRDALRLWFFEWRDADGRAWRRYFANRDEARRAMRSFRNKRWNPSDVGSRPA